MTRPKVTEGYLGCLDPQEMDAPYCSRKAGDPRTVRPVLFRSLSLTEWSIWWGQPGDAANTILHLGARGRIWALTLLLANYGVLPRSAGEAARTVWNEVGPSSPAGAKISAALHARKRGTQLKFAEAYLQNLISAHCKAPFPPGHTAPLWVELLARFAIDNLFGSLDESRQNAVIPDFHAALTGDATRPSEVYERLRSVTEAAVDHDTVAARRHARAGDPFLDNDDRGRKWKAALRYIDPVVDHLLLDNNRLVPPDAEDRSDATVARINLALKGKARLIIVSGEPLLGKKTRVKGALRMLGAESGQLVLSIRSPNDLLIDYLPVMVTSATAGSYRSLIDSVAAFLENYEKSGREHGLKLPRPRQGRRRAVHFDEAVEGLNAEFRSLPALVVITDVEAFEFDRTRHAIRDAGIRRLIEALLAANKNTRVVITTTDQITEEQARAYLARPLRTDLIPVAAPNL